MEVEALFNSFSFPSYNFLLQIFVDHLSMFSTRNNMFRSSLVNHWIHLQCFLGPALLHCSLRVSRVYLVFDSCWCYSLRFHRDYLVHNSCCHLFPRVEGQRHFLRAFNHNNDNCLCLNTSSASVVLIIMEAPNFNWISKQTQKALSFFSKICNILNLAISILAIRQAVHHKSMLHFVVLKAANAPENAKDASVVVSDCALCAII